MKKLIQYIKRMVKSYTASNSDLEIYILSKCPATAADVEHWEKQYQYKNARRNSLGGI
jgi:hypothetical protein